MAIRYLIAPEMVAAWAEHCREPPGQGQRLTAGFLHHVGMLIRTFDLWIDTAERDSQYCQPVTAVDPDDPTGLTTKQGHVFAVYKSEEIKYEEDFLAWETHFKTTFSPQSIRSLKYLQEEAFTFEIPSFVIRKPAHIVLDPKRPVPAIKMDNEGGKRTRFNDRVTVVALQDPSPPHTGPQRHRDRRTPAAPGPPRTHAPPGPPTPSDGADPQGTQYHGKLSAAIPLLKWQGINQNETLPMKLRAWRAAAPPNAPRNTPDLAGKWLCFRYCTAGLFCRAQTEGECSFAHVDLAQTGLWHRDSLCPITAWLALPAAAELGLSLTQVGVQASSRGPS